MSQICSVDTVVLRLPYKKTVRFKSGSENAGEYVLLRLRTDDGQEGVAETVARPRQSGEDGHVLQYAIQTFFEPLLHGLNPLQLRVIEKRLGLVKGNAAAKSLIEIALWDLKGKLLGIPVWSLLGGERLQIPLTWVVHGVDIDSMLEEACVRAAQGFALKLKAHSTVDRAISLVRKVREAVGAEVLIYVDANASYRPSEARRLLRDIADLDIAFAEEPCEFARLDEQASFAQSLPMPLLGDQSVKDPLHVLQSVAVGAVGAVSVKLRRSGMADSLRTTNICHAARLPVIIGTDSESRVGAMARFHLRAGLATDFAPWPIETHFFEKLADDVFAGTFPVSGGAAQVGDEPGFGVVLEEAKIREFAVRG